MRITEVGQRKPKTFISFAILAPQARAILMFLCGEIHPFLIPAS
jgi:hypothetical protein